jgi:O-antigen/teichoic acid export membrane protein
MGLHNRTDAFLLERLHKNGPHEAGIYAAAYRLLDAANMIGYLFAAILFSYWSKHTEEKQVLKKSLLFSHQLLIPAGILLAMVSIFLNQGLYSLLYHHTDEYGGEILQWCLVTIVPYFITHLYGTMLTVTGNIKLYMWIVLLSAIINVVANFLIVPVLGAKACVIISLCTQSLVAILTVISTKRQTGLSVGTKLWIKYFIIGIIEAASLFLLSKTALGIWTILLSVAGIWLVAMNLLNIFSIRSFLKLMNEK